MHIYEWRDIPTIDSVMDLSIEEAKSLKEELRDIRVMQHTYLDNFFEPYLIGTGYNIDEYIVCREKLDELVEGIDKNASELEKFAEVYYRVCKNITYDTPAAYPKSKLQQQYKEANEFRCRDLRNGLIDGKAVCAGYADILKSALNLIGVETIYVSGPANKNLKKHENFLNYYNNLKEGSFTKRLLKNRAEKENKKIEEIRRMNGHAWNRVKINGEWYNCDATWDRINIVTGRYPKNALKSSKEYEEKFGKYCNQGPECKRNFPDKELKSAFKKVYEKHKTKIAPKNIIKEVTKKVIDMYAKILIPKPIRNKYQNSKEDKRLDFEKAIITNKKEREKFEQDAGFTINELMRMGFSVNDIKRLNSEKGEKRSDIIRSEIEQKKTEKSEKKVLPFWDLRNWKGYSNQDNKTESMVNKTELENKDSNTINEAKQQDDER